MSRRWLDDFLIALGLKQPPPPPPKKPPVLWLLVVGAHGMDYWPGGKFQVHHADDRRIEIQQLGQREVAACYKEWSYYKHVMRSPDDIHRPADHDLPVPSSETG